MRAVDKLTHWALTSSFFGLIMIQLEKIIVELGY